MIVLMEINLEMDWKKRDGQILKRLEKRKGVLYWSTDMDGSEGSKMAQIKEKADDW